MKNDSILNKEEKHLAESKTVIRENISKYSAKVKELSDETKETYSEYRDDNKELYGNILISHNLKEIYDDLLCKNKAALCKPYFARIDFSQENAPDNQEFIYAYIGKKGIMRDNTHVEIVDWRTPVASIYYENESGKGFYCPDASIDSASQIAIDLTLKRTFDIEEDGLHGFYDSDIAANDELLIKYLSKNKTAGLDDIIATIQKEQSKAIRTNPFHNLIIQGTAGSGKTTVIVHRISYILYNYSKFFEPNQFCIVGSSDVLIKYIASGLPEVDVYHVKHKRMDELLAALLDREWKKSFRLVETRTEQAYKSKMRFILELERYLFRMKERRIPSEKIMDEQLGVLLKKEGIVTLIQDPKYSINQTIKILSGRLTDRLQTELSCYSSENLRAERKKKYRQYFEKYKIRQSVTKIYQEFLNSYALTYNIENMEEHCHLLQKGKFDLYDIGALLLIYFHTKQMKKNESFGQVFIDEGQEYGPAIYYILKKTLGECYFTIVGDVCQNINSHTGMDSWEELQIKIFAEEKDDFKVLNKSYRNTIEISNYARGLLSDREKQLYQMEAVIRHGKPVKTIKAISNEEAAGLVQDFLPEITKQQYHTIGILCFSEKQMKRIKKRLADTITLNEMKQDGFQDGITVLPIPMAKGLEFDAVIVIKHGFDENMSKEELGRWMYVAATRALHELYVIE